MKSACVAFVLALSAPFVSLSRADDPGAESYGRGVSAYRAAKYEIALQEFDQAIYHGMRAPEAYYFRGFSHFRLGKNAEGMQDFKTGAALEAVSDFVASSIEPLQGRARVKLEEIRASASEQQQRRRDELRRRYEELNRRDSDVLRPPVAPIPRP